MNKYATGVPLGIPEDKSEQEIAIKEWAEGNPHLEEALRQCIEHNIITIASCAGHKDTINGNDPYLAIKITEETRRRVYSIFNTVFKARNCVKSFDISNEFKYGETISTLSITSKSATIKKSWDLTEEEKAKANSKETNSKFGRIKDSKQIVTNSDEHTI